MVLTLSHGGESTFAASTPSNEILVGTKDGIVRLTREAPGRTWRQGERWLTNMHIHALVVDPASGAIVAGAYEGAEHDEGAVHVSEDGGASWERRGNGLSETSVYCMARARANGASRIYVGTEPAHLFYSDDLGHRWTELPALRSVDMAGWEFPAPPFYAHAKHINLDPSDPNTLYVGIEQGGLLKTTDGGETFAALSGMHYDVHRTAIDPTNPDQICMSTGVGTYVSGDGGANWTQTTDIEHPIGRYPDCMVLRPNDPSTIFVAAAETGPGGWAERGTSGSRLSLSSDSGMTWTPLRNGLPDRLTSSFQAVSIEDWGESFAVYGATTTGEVWASEDGGENWGEIISGLPPVSKSMHYVLLDPSNTWLG